jgi:hypothetical protein
VHAGHRDRALAGHAVVDRDDAAAVDAPGHLVLVLAGGDAAVAFDAALGVAENFIRAMLGAVSSFALVVQAAAFSIWQTVVLVSCIIVTES